ncbi:MAG: ABC transporter permease [Armatimonadota bacterium]
MSAYILRRLLLIVPQAVMLALVTFLMVRLLPGNPAALIAGPMATPEMVAAVEEWLGLHEPLHQQFVAYLGRLVHGDLGRSWYTGRAVSEDLLQRLPHTLELIGPSLFLAVAIGVPVGAFLARAGTGWLGRALSPYMLSTGAIPAYWLGLVLTFALAFQLRWAPPPFGRLDPSIGPPAAHTGFLLIDSLLVGNADAIRSVVAHLVLPVLTLVLVTAGNIMKMTRSLVRETLLADYIRTARAKGLAERSVLLRHALRNALIPIITLVGVMFGYLLTGAVLVETVFAWGGLGQYAVQAVTNSDYAAIQGVVLLTAILSMLAYLLIDILYLAADPRIRYR